MSYVKNNLLEGETVTYTARPSWWSLVPLIILSAILFWTIVMPLVLIYYVVQFKFTEIAITNRRVFYKKGVIARDVHEINLNRVEGIIIQQGWAGRIFNFGSVDVHGTGAGNIVLSDIDNPVSFRQAVQRQIGLSDIFPVYAKTRKSSRFMM